MLDWFVRIYNNFSNCLRGIAKYLLLLVLPSLILACGGSGGGSPAPTSLYLPPQVEVQKNNYVSLTVYTRFVVGDVPLVVTFIPESPSIASLSPSSTCTIPQGQNQCSVQVRGNSEGSSLLKATASGLVSASTPVIVTRIPTLDFNPEFLDLDSGESSQITIQTVFNVLSPVTVTMTARNPNVVAFANANTCTIQTGTNSCSVGIIANSVSTDGESTLIDARSSGYENAAPMLVTVTNLPTVSFILPSLTIPSNNSSTYVTAQLSRKAGPDGVSIAFQSSDIGIVSVVGNPPACNVPAGQTMCSVTVQGESIGVADLYVSAAGYLPGSALAINVISSGTVSILGAPTSVSFGSSVILTAQLSKIAPIGGTTVNFISDNQSVAKFATASCDVPSGKTTCSVSLSGDEVGSASLSVYASGYQSAIAPAVSVVMNQSVSFMNASESVAMGGSGVSVVATLSKPTSTSVTINFSTNNALIAEFSNPSCVVPAGQSSCSSKLIGKSLGTVSLYANATGYTPSSSEVVNVVNSGVLSFINPDSSIAVGSSGSIMAQISGVAGDNGVTVDFDVNNPSLELLKDSCTIPAGQNACSIQYKGNALGTVSLYATALSYGTSSTTIVIGSSGTMSFVNPAPTVTIGSSVSYLLQLSSPATSNVVVNFSVNSPAATLSRTTCDIPAGQSACSVSVTGNSADMAVSLYASAASYGTAANTTISVINAGTLLLNGPIAVQVGSLTSLSAQLSSPAGNNGVVVSFISENTFIASLNSASCTVPAGQTICSVQVTGNEIGYSDLYATAPGYGSATSYVNVTSLGIVRFVSVSDTLNVSNGTKSSIMIQLPKPTATALVVGVATGDSSVASISTPTCSIPAGQSFCYVEIDGESLGSTDLYIIPPENYYAGSALNVNVISNGVFQFANSVQNLLLESDTSVSVVLSKPAPEDIYVTVSSSDPTIVSIQNPTCMIRKNQSSCFVSVYGVQTGNTDLYAYAAGYPVSISDVTVVNEGLASITPSTINLASGGGRSTVTALLSKAAGNQGVVVSFSVSNTAAVSLSTNSCTIPSGQDSCSLTLTGNSAASSVLLYISAANYSSNPATVNVLSNSIVLSPDPLNINFGESGNLTATLSSTVVYPVSVSFASESAPIANVLSSTCTIPAGNTNCYVNVMGLQANKTTRIHASAVNFASDVVAVNVGGGS